VTIQEAIGEIQRLAALPASKAHWNTLDSPEDVAELERVLRAVASSARTVS
jgi:hypothetical protein